MIAQRSKRERKKINYAAFGDDDDGDDDFADPTPPNKKKSLSSNKENKKSKERSKEETKNERKKMERPSLEDKLYERQLQEALSLSMCESQGSSDCEGVNIVEPPPKQAPVETTPCIDKTEDDQSRPHVPVEVKIEGAASSPDVLPDKQAPVPSVKRAAESGGDEIQILESGVSTEEQPAKRRRVTPSKKSNYVESDSEESEFTAESESDFDNDEGDDSDFSEFESKKESKKKTTPVAKKAAPAVKAKASNKESKPSAKSKPATTPKLPVTSKKTISSPIRSTGSARSSIASGGPSRKAAWTPPAVSSCKSSVGGSTLTSPTSGIRLGLSRNQRVKPLHPSLKVHH